MTVPEADFDAAFGREHRRLFTIAFSILRDADEAADAVQETMWQAWKHWSDVREEAKRPAWLTSICVRHCIRRKSRLAKWFRSIPDHVEPVAVERGPGRAQLMDLERAWRKLPARQRAAVYLHYRKGHTIEECAGLMGNSPGTVRTHVQRALARLRSELADES